MRGGAQQDPFQAGHPWPVSVLYVIPIHFIWRKKPAMNSVAYKKERKQLKPVAAGQAWWEPVCKDLVLSASSCPTDLSVSQE